ncbi:MAG: hypothetical protein H6548_09100 [Chitinophagales bacterium]|nr:hypothetical protein [Chitinophagales bacterium]MCB9019412.1 hypothetical protein [Chitinophagales bacterium]MCB9022264.1 hypothetical protein [Chitinophagales bacterium]HPE98720.1 hypothetical protein [Chitinophagales bacterium]HPR30184.1 hypothetical protein [Chitinophagales bacterium]
MNRQIFLWGLLSGLMSTLAGFIWDRVYFFAMMADFSRVINLWTILAASMIGTMVAVAGFAILNRWMKKGRDITFNLLLSVITIASLVLPLSYALPLDIDFPEVFPALALPMHFFPAMALFTLRPVFLK